MRLCKDIQVKHLKRWEVLSLLKAEIFYRALPWTELLLNTRYLDPDLNLSHSSRLSVILAFALVMSVAMSTVAPWWLVVDALLSLALLIINLDVYRFFHQKRGLMFTLQVIPWHWFYFLYGGASFAYGVMKYSLNSLTRLYPLNAQS